MRHKNQKYILCLFFMAAMVSFVLLLFDECQTTGALWIAILCLTPALIISLNTNYLSLKIFCFTALITQILTVPAFYLQPDQYHSADYRLFYYTAMEALPVYLRLGLFLFLVAFLVRVSQSLIRKPMQISYTPPHMVATEDNEIKPKRRLNKCNAKNHRLFKVSIFLLIAISLPVKFWMFDMGIGIVGAQSPSLPYRLSGILTYLFGLIIPISIGYLYIKTKRTSLLLALLISGYSLLIGLASASKSAVLMATAPVIAFAWSDKRWAIFGSTFLLAGVGVILAVASRDIVYVSYGMKIFPMTELGFWRNIVTTSAKLKWSPEMFLIYIDIAGRFDSFQGLFLASQFNADAVGGSGKILIKSINNHWVNLDHDAMHLEFLGSTVPIGFYNIPASFNAWMLMAINRSLVMVLPFAFYAALTIIILEKALMRAAYKARQNLPIAQAAVFFLTLWFYTAPGTTVFLSLMAVAIIFGFLPPIRLGHILRTIRLYIKRPI